MPFTIQEILRHRDNARHDASQLGAPLGLMLKAYEILATMPLEVIRRLPEHELGGIRAMALAEMSTLIASAAAKSQ